MKKNKPPESATPSSADPSLDPFADLDNIGEGTINQVLDGDIQPPPALRDREREEALRYLRQELDVALRAIESGSAALIERRVANRGPDGKFVRDADGNISFETRRVHPAEERFDALSAEYRRVRSEYAAALRCGPNLRAKIAAEKLAREQAHRAAEAEAGFDPTAEGIIRDRDFYAARLEFKRSFAAGRGWKTNPQLEHDFIVGPEDVAREAAE